jgi:hypothetical protein
MANTRKTIEKEKNRHNPRLEWTEPYFVLAAIALCKP